MYSLSHVIFFRNWITAGCSLFLWLGLSLATINATASAASANPDSSDRITPLSKSSLSQSSDQPNTQANAAEVDVVQASAAQADAAQADAAQADADKNLALWQSAVIIDLAMAEPTANSTNLQASTHPSDTPTNAQLSASDESSDRPAEPLAFATLLPEAIPPEEVAAPIATTHESAQSSEFAQPTEVAQQPVAIPTFANTDECFADCNPSERFDFRPPAQLSLSPVAPRVAQAPYLSSPPAAGSTTGAPTTAAPTTGVPTTAAPAGTAPVLGQPAPTATNAAALDSPLPSSALTPPSLHFQGVYIYQGDESSARARITGVYPLTPRIQVGGTIDLTEGDVFSEGGEDGVNINELYITLAPQNLPNLRFVLGQLDLTSYFDRNSFAKDAATQFFNPVFSTNPALAAAGIGSRQGALVNWTITDNLEARAVIFSSDRSISEFELNAFAGELGLRLGNLIVRGTYVTSEDSGSGDGFQEIFNIDRGNGQFGAQEGDRENAYGVNAEYFIPEINVGLFGRYGYYENTDLDEGGDAFNFGINVYDLFMESDRLGVGYGQALSNAEIRQDNDDEIPSVLEVFYDFRLLPGIRVGVSYQSLNEFSESIAGFRVRGDFNLVPRQP